MKTVTYETYETYGTYEASLYSSAVVRSSGLNVEKEKKKNLQ